MKNKIQINLPVFLLLFVPLLNLLAQEDKYVFSNASMAEKIYLQLDGNIYATEDIIWFKCIVLESYGLRQTSLSGVLNVELIGPNETVHDKKLIKLENGIGQGFFYLDKSISEGPYLIRAYTRWNKNFGSDFYFKEYIKVFTTDKENIVKKPISGITLIKEQGKTRYLRARFHPKQIDSLHHNKMTVFITIDDKKDSLSIRESKNDEYRINYEIKGEGQLATLQMQTDMGLKYSSSILLDDDSIDLQFFPESGELVHGLISKVGFKALNSNGQGTAILGDIIDENDSIITTFKSNSLGMGSFVLGRADSSKLYFARLKQTQHKENFVMYSLPKVAPLGNVLSVKEWKNNIILSCKSNYLIEDSIHVNISCRGVVYYDLKLGMKKGSTKILIPNNKFPEGIVSFIMMDNFMRPLAERLYFNQRPECRVHIDILADKDVYQPREPTKLNICTSNYMGQDLKTNLSVLVINKKERGKLQTLRQNILSQFLLSSELKGEIENPGFYFQKDSNMAAHLDALMLTQGWSKYNYSKPNTKLIFQPETQLSVSGVVSSALLKQKKKSADLTLMTFGNERSFYKQTADKDGKFCFKLKDEFGKNMNILLQSADNSGQKKNYNVKLNKDESPQISFNHLKTLEEPDSVVNVIVKEKLEKNRIDKAFPLQSGNIILNELEVQGYHLSPNRKKVQEEYGDPDEVIDGREILEKEEKWSYGLYSVLLFNYRDKVDIFRASDGILYAKVLGSDITLVVIDGIPAKYYEYDLIPNIPPSEVSSVEVIKCAKNIKRLYFEATGMHYPDPLLCGSVIAIYTHGKSGLYGANEPVGLLLESVPVFSAPREFYSPKYDNKQNRKQNKPDLRSLIYWEPTINTDSLGNASLLYYNGDKVGDMMIVVEAISKDGSIGYQELEYEIEGQEKEFIIVK